MAEKPFLLGLTGSIGMGKTETAKMFAGLGVPVYDADAAVHEVYQQGGEAVGPIGEAFPVCVKDGRVDRAALAKTVVDDAEALARLEAIVHPIVRKKQQAFIDAAAAQGADLVVLDIPLLFETGTQSRLDAVAVVSAPAELQRARVMTREGMTVEKLERILARQMSDVDKRALADFVVDTSQGFEHAKAQVRKIIADVRERRIHA